MTRALLALCLLLATAARADVEDLSTGRRPGASRSPPAMVALRVQGGTDYAPAGVLGGTLSWYNDYTQIELEGSIGWGNPGAQYGFAVRKLFGGDNDFIVSELAIAGNPSAHRGGNPLVPGSGHALWTNLGLGFEHRSFLCLSVTGGLTFLGFSETPTGYLQGGVGFGF